MMRFVTVVGLTAYATSVAAQDCTPEKVQAVADVPLTTLIAKTRGASLKKDEFETTAAYQQRVAAAGTALPSDYVRVTVPYYLSMEYNADTQTVSISPYSIPLLCGLYESSLPAEAKAVQFGKAAQTSYGVTLGKPFCLSHVVSSIPGTPYQASNSYGAKVTVLPKDETAEGIYFGYGDSGQDLIRGREKYSSDPAFAFTATPDDARSLKANAALAFLVKPIAPYMVAGTGYVEPKINSPVEITTKTDYLVANGRCIAVVDRKTGKVFAAASMGTKQ